MKTLLSLHDEELKEIAGGLNSAPPLEAFLDNLAAEIFGQNSSITRCIDTILADIFGNGGGTQDSKTTF